MSANQTGIKLALAALLAGFPTFAQPPNPRLLSLAPPDSQLVAGAVAPIQLRNRGYFLLFARANTLDLEDFFSLVGADASNVIAEVVFAASAGKDGAYVEHSLLASGHFNSYRIYESARKTSTPGEYRGVHFIAVHPFDRERGVLDHDRWLAIIDSHLAIFGTMLSVQQEVDRLIDGSPADPVLLNRLRVLQNNDDTWCLLSSLALGAEIPRLLRKLDPAFAEINSDTNTLLYGIRFGRRVEFEYAIQGMPAGPIKATSTPPLRGFIESANTRYSPPEQGPALRRVVRISRSRYEKWLSDLTPH